MQRGISCPTCLTGIGVFYYLNLSFARKCPVPFGAIKFLAKGKLTAARYLPTPNRNNPQFHNQPKVTLTLKFTIYHKNIATIH
jgi:hypothetical protein